MENKYMLAVLLAVAAGVFAISVASAHGTDNAGSGFGMGMMQGNYAHNQDDIDWMKGEMKEHMNLTDEEADEMAGHCPMMRSR